MSEIITTPETLGRSHHPRCVTFAGTSAWRRSSSWSWPRRRRSASSAAWCRWASPRATARASPRRSSSSTVILLLFAVGFTALTPYVDEAGAFFSYVRKSLGFPTGIGIAFVALVSYVAIEAGVYGLLGPRRRGRRRTVRRPVPAVVAVRRTGVRGHHVPRIPQHPAVQPGAGSAADRRDRHRGGARPRHRRAAAATTAFRTGIVNPNAIFSGSLGIGLLFALISYVGFEATAIFRDEARTPERTIPRATYAALILIGVFYAITSWALVSAWGDEEAVAQATDSGGTFLADTATRYIGVVGADVITVLYFTSLFACILAFHNVASRYVFALSQTRRAARSRSAMRTTATVHRIRRRCGSPVWSPSASCWPWCSTSIRPRSSTPGSPAPPPSASSCC